MQLRVKRDKGLRRNLYINLSSQLHSLSPTLILNDSYSIQLFDMEILLPIFVSVLLASAQADIKILSTPDGVTGPEPCIRTCSGVDKNHSRWYNSDTNPGKVFKWIDMSGCDFVSQPVVTAMSGEGIGNEGLCPSFTAAYVQSNKFFIYSVTDFRADTMKNNACRVFWTATGFTC